MATENQVAKRHLTAGEDIIFIQRGSVMTAMLDPASGRPVPIDEFGTSKGWLAVTSEQRGIYGYFAALGGAKFGSSFSFTRWDKDPRGVALINEDIGPIDICVFIPKTISPAAMHGAMAKAFGSGTAREDREIRHLQELYANRVSFGGLLLAELEEINAIYGRLRDLGSDADQALVDQQKVENAALNPMGNYHEPHLSKEWFDRERPDRH
jgi:hypothetical protein